MYIVEILGPEHIHLHSCAATVVLPLTPAEISQTENHNSPKDRVAGDSTPSLARLRLYAKKLRAMTEWPEDAGIGNRIGTPKGALIYACEEDCKADLPDGFENWRQLYLNDTGEPEFDLTWEVQLMPGVSIARRLRNRYGESHKRWQDWLEKRGSTVGIYQIALEELDRHVKDGGADKSVVRQKLLAKIDKKE